MPSAMKNLANMLIIGALIAALFVGDSSAGCQPGHYYPLKCSQPGKLYEVPKTGCQGYLACAHNGGNVQCCGAGQVYKPGAHCVPKNSYHCPQP